MRRVYFSLVLLGFLIVGVGVNDGKATLIQANQGGDSYLFDDQSDLYWIDDLDMIQFKTYHEKLEAIDALNEVGYAGFNDWHMAYETEVLTLFEYEAFLLGELLGFTEENVYGNIGGWANNPDQTMWGVGSIQPLDDEADEFIVKMAYFASEYDMSGVVNTTLGIYVHDWLSEEDFYDWGRGHRDGAWITRSNNYTPVPEPTTILLFTLAIGLISGMQWVKLK